MTSRGLRTGAPGIQAMTTVWVPTNSVSSLGIAVFKKHYDHFTQMRVQLIECRALAVCAREPRHVAHVELLIGATLDHGGIGVHGGPQGADGCCG
jgi:hypothetical protein